MKVSKERMVTEALRRIKEMEDVFGLNPDIYKCFSEGEVYCSYLNAGTVGCIDTIDHDERYSQIVQAFEEKYGCLVFHVIKTGCMLDLLYVGDKEDDWEGEVLFDNKYIAAYVHNFEKPECSELGDIIVTGTEGGALLRIV